MNAGSIKINTGDIDFIINRIVEAERLPKQQYIDRELSNISSSISAYAQILELLHQMKDLVESFRQKKAFSARNINTSDKNVLAILTNDAVEAKYSINVLQLAQKHKIISNLVSKKEKFGPGIVQIQLNQKQFSIKVRPNSKLTDIMEQINKSDNNPGIQSSIINEIKGQRLLIASNISGEENVITIKVNTHFRNSLNKLNYHNHVQKGTSTKLKEGTNLSMIQVQQARNSKATIDGITTISNPENIIENSIFGVKFILKSTTKENEPETEVEVTHNEKKVLKSIEELVESYNQLYKKLKAFEEFNPKTGKSGVLASDNVIRNINSNFKSLFSSKIESDDKEIQSLTELGITTTRQGTLEINYDILNKQLKTNFNKLSNFFNGNQGFLRRTENTIENMMKITGAIRVREKSLMKKNHRLLDEQLTLDHRMKALEKRTRAKFTLMQNATNKMEYQLSGMINMMSR
ncbi:flagellar filament capping protein FliD [Candidatus Photodesmus anomalopis]|uniref:Flagellar hook-associated protein 2 n=1 Tax=Candidatus Photodesmus katoptron Akat1 TaxID=1236703 RepID=S3E141_9GAMM|nr:flagellar filament capping protein FliD [Candidatus Photodesmus katoptron]EPE37896.1 flagellar hook-associated protein 2 C-terminus protein [Candidatus Photodesmus katoptron Akat1]